MRPRVPSASGRPRPDVAARLGHARKSMTLACSHVLLEDGRNPWLLSPFRTGRPLRWRGPPRTVRSSRERRPLARRAAHGRARSSRDCVRCVQQHPAPPKSPQSRRCSQQPHTHIAAHAASHPGAEYRSRFHFRQMQSEPSPLNEMPWTGPEETASPLRLAVSPLRVRETERTPLQRGPSYERVSVSPNSS